jgi:hypothetical protein
MSLFRGDVCGISARDGEWGFEMIFNPQWGEIWRDILTS